MTRRTRTVAGTLALAAMTFAFAETLLASVCTPMAAMDAPGTAMVDASIGDVPSGEMGCLLMRGQPDGQDGGERDSHCPLNPAVGSGCTAVASLPAPQVVATASGQRARHAPPAQDVGSELLLTHSLFRPPRA